MHRLLKETKGKRSFLELVIGIFQSQGLTESWGRDFSLVSEHRPTTFGGQPGGCRGNRSWIPRPQAGQACASRKHEHRDGVASRTRAAPALGRGRPDSSGAPRGLSGHPTPVVPRPLFDGIGHRDRP